MGTTNIVALLAYMFMLTTTCIDSRDTLKERLRAQRHGRRTSAGSSHNPDEVSHVTFGILLYLLSFAVTGMILMH